MLAQQLFHPGHVVPGPKFIAAFLELPHQPEAHMGVELQAVSGQVGVLRRRSADAGVQVPDPLGPGQVLQGPVEPPAYALPPGVPPEVDAGLRDRKSVV